jgi:hypothetical protein
MPNAVATVHMGIALYAAQSGNAHTLKYCKHNERELKMRARLTVKSSRAVTNDGVALSSRVPKVAVILLHV